MKRLIVFFLLLSILTSCGDNLFNSESDTTDKTNLDRLEFALNEKDYDFIIDKLGNKDFNSLSLREKYLIQCALMGKSGFSLLGNLGDLFDDDIKFTDILMKTQTDGNNISQASIELKRFNYSVIKKVCSDSDITDGDNEFICGLAAALDTMMLISDMARRLGSGSVSFDPDSPDYIGKILGSKSEDEIKLLVDQGFIDSITSNMDQLDSAMNNLAGKDESVKNKMNDFKTDLTGGSSSATPDSVYAFISKYFVGSGGSGGPGDSGGSGDSGDPDDTNDPDDPDNSGE
ncbi:MAG: hypothetical protein LBH05_00495 [Deferribacteraceae bacterium]|nr:hypothetical protein [Deferribacteraceae bacterium]